MLARRNRIARNDQSGFVLVFVAFSAVALLTIGALAFDVTTWVVRSNKLQNDAEAAALAGVVFMPYQFEKAKTTALATLADNQIVPSTTLAVTISKVDKDPRQLKVAVTDTNVRASLGGFVVKKITLTRDATAVYEAPIAVGSPQNRFGVGSPSIGGGEQQHFWAAINGYCSEARSGDLLQTGYLQDESTSPSTWDCSYPYTSANPHYNGNSGYVFTADLSAAATNQRLQIYDGTFLKEAVDRHQSIGFCEYFDALEATQDAVYPTANCDSVQVNTTFTIMWDKPHTPYDPTDDELVQTPTTLPTVTVCNTSPYCKQWQTLATLSAGERYRITAVTDKNPALNSRGVNTFALRLFQSGAAVFNACSTDRSYSAGPTAGCPTITAENVMSGFIQGYDGSFGAGSLDPPYFHTEVSKECQNKTGNKSCFYLAQISPNYAGKEASITIFDPDAGTNGVRTMMPVDGADGDHRPVDTTEHLTYTDKNGAAVAPANMPDGWIGWQEGAYNGKTLKINFTIPSDYDCDISGQSTSRPSCWWYVNLRYKGEPVDVHDRTTWSIQILGDPVHLIA